MAGRRWRCAKPMIRSRRVSKYASAATSSATDAILDQRRECGVQFLVGAGFGDDDTLIDGARRLLDLLQLALGRRKARILQNPDEGDTWHQVAQQAKPFRLHETCQQGD